ncbi:MAG: hypothetical protein HY261_09405, partial [Chloroflexi bacterium]|nr:hypothetical protein [Chloroflexota bacterium]
MNSITAPWVLFWRRVRANWRFLAILFAGILLATTLLAATPLYLDSIKEIGLRHALKYETRGVLDTAVLVPSRPLDESGYARTRSRVLGREQETIGSIVQSQVGQIKTPPLNLNLPAVSGTIKASVQSYADYESHSSVVEGAFPKTGHRADGSATVIEAAIGRNSANAFHLQLGDSITVAPVGDPNRQLTAVITGILQPNDISELYWSFTIDPFSPQTDSSSGADIPMLPVLVSEAAYLGDIAPSFRGMIVDYWWFFYIDPSRINGGNVQQIRAAIGRLETQLAADAPGTLVLSGLGSTLDDFQNKLFFSRIPVLMMAVVVGAIILYYLVMVANVVVERHLAEIALFRSRGADGLQVMAVYLWEAALMCAAAVVLAPFLARLLVPLLGHAPAFHDVTNGSGLPASLTLSVFYLALVGGGLCLAALFLPALRGARFNLLDVRKVTARPPLGFLFHKCFIDLFLLAMAGLLYWELTQRGALVTQRLFGKDSVDDMLLVAPVLLMLALALLCLRVLPWLLRFLAAIAGRTGRVWLALALWNLGRNPIHYLRPALLLMLVAALAMFAVSYNGTLERSFHDRGLFASGSDARIANIPPSESAPAEVLTSDLEAIHGVKLASPAYRSGPNQSFGTSGRNLDLLAVDSIKFNRVAFYRDDFSSTDLFTLLRQLDRGRSITRGRDLPKDATGIGVWVKSQQERSATTVWVRIKDGDGRLRRYRIGRLDSDVWKFMRADFVNAAGQPLKGPFVLESVYLFELDFPNDPFPLDTIANGHTSQGKVNLSGLTAFTPAGPTVFDALEAPNGWAAMNTSALFLDALKADTVVRRDGRSTVELAWKTSPGTGTRGMFPADTTSALPIVASDRFLGSAGRKVGDKVEITVAGVPVPVEIVGSAAFFPTMDPNKPFVLGNVDSLLYYANLCRGLNTALPNEVWLSLSDKKDDRAAFFDKIRFTTLGP